MDEFESKKACLEYLLLEEETPVRSEQKIENPIEENLSPKKNENLQNKRWKSKFNEKLKIKYTKKIFGLIKIAIIVLIFTLIFQLIYTSLNLYHKPKAELITNLLKIYTLGSDISNTMAMTHTFFLQAVIFNNTVPCWDGKTSLECYVESRDHMNQLLVKDVSESAEFDLGNFTEKFSEILTKVNFFFPKNIPEKIIKKYFNFFLRGIHAKLFSTKMRFILNSAINSMTDFSPQTL